MINILFGLLSLGLFLSSASSVFAQTPTLTPTSSLKNTIKEQKKEIKDEFKEKIQESKEQRKTITEEFKNRISSLILRKGVVNGKISTISGTTVPTTIIINKGSKTTTLNITNKTNLLRKFGGKSSLSEMKVGDQVNAVGTWTDSNKNTLDAKVVRDLSIQKRFGAFWGKIKSITDASSFVLETIERGNQTVKTDGNTKIVNRKEVPISFSDLKVGDRVRVKGVWDSALKSIEEVTSIKNWTLMPKPLLTPTPTPTPI